MRRLLYLFPLLPLVLLVLQTPTSPVARIELARPTVSCEQRSAALVAATEGATTNPRKPLAVSIADAPSKTSSCALAGPLIDQLEERLAFVEREIAAWDSRVERMTTTLTRTVVVKLMMVRAARMTIASDAAADPVIAQHMDQIEESLVLAERRIAALRDELDNTIPLARAALEQEALRDRVVAEP